MGKSKPATPETFMEVVLERRRQNVLFLIEAYGGLRRFSTVIHRDGAQVSGIVTDTLAARNPCGERLARAIEEIVGLPMMWMDQDHGEGPPVRRHPRERAGFGGKEEAPRIDWSKVPGMKGRKPTKAEISRLI
jgi:hypothetical protein